MIGLYIRVSTAQQTDKYSIPTQIEQGMKFSNGIEEPFQIYQETGSGSTIDKRSELQRLLNDIENGLINKVWVIESSRLTRDTSDAIILQKTFSKNNVKLYVNDRHVDFSSPESIFQYQISSAVSELERAQITKRSIRGKSKWQNEGRMVVPSLYGWDYEFDKQGNKVWKPVDKEVEVIKQIYNLYIEGYAYNRIRTHLYSVGIRNRIGNELMTASIKKILNQSLYIGKTWTTEGIPIDSLIYKPIIEEDLFYTVQAKIKSNVKVKKKWYKAKNDFSGILKCYYCGKTFFYDSNQMDGYINEYYYHSATYCGTLKQRSYRKDDIEEFIHDSILDLFTGLIEKEEEMIEEWLYPNKVTPEEEVVELQKSNMIIKERLSNILKSKNVVIDFGLDGTLNKDDVKTKVDSYNKEYKELIFKQTDNNEKLRDLSFSKDKDYLKMMHDIALEWEDLSIDRRRELYNEVFKSIMINNDDLIFHCFNDKIVDYPVPLFLLKRRSKK